MKKGVALFLLVVAAVAIVILPAYTYNPQTAVYTLGER